MKKTIFALAFVLVLIAGCSEQPAQKTELVIYTYDSMVSEYGLGPKVVPKFEEQCDCSVKMVAKGDAGQVLSAVILEKENPKADLVIGVDNSLIGIAIDSNAFEKFTAQNNFIVPYELEFERTNPNRQGYFTPYDYGYFAFIYDSNKVSGIDSFESLLDNSLEKKIAIQNPRTSSPGLGLLLWSVAVYGDPGYKEFWQKMKKNVLTVTAGWDESAGLFAAGEVPIYLSYSTSPPYYVQFENKPNYMAAKFSEGHYVQVEGMGIVKGAKNRELAQKFIEFSLTEKFQQEIPLNQFMYPVNQDVVLPESFSYAFKPEKQLELEPELISQKQEEWISEWEKIMKSP